MAVVYADLRFTRASSHVAEVTEERAEEDWDVTYENITKPKQGANPSQTTCSRGLPALPQLVTITLLLLSCALLAVVIGLSVRLSQVSERHLKTAAELQHLQGEHEELDSRFTQDTLRKDDRVQMLEGELREAQRELEETKAAWQEVQERWRTTSLELQRAMKEKEDTEDARRRLHEVLLSTQNELGGKESQLTRCENTLKGVRTEKQTSDRILAQTRRDLQNTRNSLQSTQSDLSQKNMELSTAQKSLQDTKKKAEEITRDSEQRQERLSYLEESLSDTGKCLTSKDCSPVPAADENSSDSYKYCPPGWHQIGKRCYYFSSQQKPRIDAEQDCQQRSATLARVEEEHSALKDIIKSYSRGFWIGLHRNDTTWMWPDKTIKDFRGTDGQNCAKASPQLSAEACRTALPWICETTIRTCSSTTEALRCLQPLKWEIGAISI